MDYLEKIKRIEQEKPRTHADWLKAWRELADITTCITDQQDPRFHTVMQWLDIADSAFALDSWESFLEAAEEVKRIVKNETGKAN